LIEEKRKKFPRKWLVVGIIIAIIVVASVVYAFTVLNRPDIEITDVKGERYNVGTELNPEYRANVTATIQNHGDTGANVTVKLYVEWSGHTEYEMKTVFVEAHSTIDVTSNLEASSHWLEYGAELIEVKKV